MSKPKYTLQGTGTAPTEEMHNVLSKTYSPYINVDTLWQNFRQNLAAKWAEEMQIEYEDALERVDSALERISLVEL